MSANPSARTQRSAEEIRAEIETLVAEYHRVAHAAVPFEPGRTRLSYAGRVYDERELQQLVAASLDFWLTAGPCATRFERAMRARFGSRDFALVNSGSSANLAMVSTLCAQDLPRWLPKDAPAPLRPGDEVITPAVTFPTTLAPIVQNALVPVFVDCELGTYNVDPELLEGAIGPRTRALFIPHTLGNPCDLGHLEDLARRHGLWLLEDCCDALGATWDGRPCGSFGAMASLSFFPAHHLTMGEGGGVVVNARGLARSMRSIRDWGRDCWCEPGCSDTCGRRFDWQQGDLPRGYDHKYVYSNIGYNLKATDLQAAVGLAQLEKLDSFVAARRRNFFRLRQALEPLQGRLLLPRVDSRAGISPFGFAVTTHREEDRPALVRHLEAARIETRLLFGGDILRQPGYRAIRRRIHGSLERSEAIMRRTLFVGVYPGLDDAKIDYMAEAFHRYFAPATAGFNREAEAAAGVGRDRTTSGTSTPCPSPRGSRPVGA